MTDDVHSLPRLTVERAEGVTVRNVFAASCAASHALVPVEFDNFTCIHCGGAHTCHACTGALAERRCFHLMSGEAGESYWADVQLEIAPEHVLIQRALEDQFADVASVGRSAPLPRTP